MATTRTITIDGRDYKARASALTPKLYRYHFGHDLIQDMSQLAAAYEKKQKEGKSYTPDDLTVFERTAWLFLKQGGEDVGDDPDAWLDSLDGVFSIYSALPQLLALWAINTHTTAIPKKKLD